MPVELYILLKYHCWHISAIGLLQSMNRELRNTDFKSSFSMSYIDLSTRAGQYVHYICRVAIHTPANWKLFTSKWMSENLTVESIITLCTSIVTFQGGGLIWMVRLLERFDQMVLKRGWPSVREQRRLFSDVLKHRLSTLDVPMLLDDISNFCRAVIKVSDKMCPLFILFLCLFVSLSYFGLLKGSINHLLKGTLYF